MRRLHFQTATKLHIISDIHNRCLFGGLFLSSEALAEVVNESEEPVEDEAEGKDSCIGETKPAPTWDDTAGVLHLFFNDAFDFDFQRIGEQDGVFNDSVTRSSFHKDGVGLPDDDAVAPVVRVCDDAVVTRYSHYPCGAACLCC